MDEQRKTGSTGMPAPRPRASASTAMRAAPGLPRPTTSCNLQGCCDSNVLMSGLRLNRRLHRAWGLVSLPNARRPLTRAVDLGEDAPVTEGGERPGEVRLAVGRVDGRCAGSATRDCRIPQPLWLRCHVPRMTKGNSAREIMCFASSGAAKR
jgi:hypothetical protein